MRWYLRRPASRLRNIKERNDPLDEIKIQLFVRESDHRPPSQHRFEILLGIFGVARASAVPATARLENSTFDLDERAARQMRKISAPSAGSMELDFPLQSRSLRNAPEE
mgnify:CR=1 FL=1